MASITIVVSFKYDVAVLLLIVIKGSHSYDL